MSEWKERAKPIHTNDPLYWIDRGAWRIAIWETRKTERRFTHRFVLSYEGKQIWTEVYEFSDSLPNDDHIKAGALAQVDRIMGEWKNG